MTGEDPYGEGHANALGRIASTLGVPVEAFLAADPAAGPDLASAGMDLDASAQVLALLRLFVRLKSPEARARCLSYVVQEAIHDG
ncbi:hypothetical protein [Methylobacterium sp. SD21]|jgi:hypothetical protein|uniref:hypothetical protein n=1 Tax=Methylobacterium litchii TaxID=3138810 RepID=UPI00313C0CAA